MFEPRQIFRSGGLAQRFPDDSGSRAGGGGRFNVRGCERGLVPLGRALLHLRGIGCAVSGSCPHCALYPSPQSASAIGQPGTGAAPTVPWLKDDSIGPFAHEMLEQEDATEGGMFWGGEKKGTLSSCGPLSRTGPGLPGCTRRRPRSVVVLGACRKYWPDNSSRSCRSA